MIAAGTPPLGRWLRALRRDERGVSVIEFAFAAPLLSLFVLGIGDLGQGLSERFTIQQAVNRGLEMIQGRPVSAAATATDVNYDFVKTEAEAAAGTGAVVTMTQWLECDGIPKTNFNDSCAEGEDTARYVRLHIAKTYNAHFLGAIPMVATGALRVQ
jgi:Flp pilus assembly protein TadG